MFPLITASLSFVEGFHMYNPIVGIIRQWFFTYSVAGNTGSALIFLKCEESLVLSQNPNGAYEPPVALHKLA